MLKRTLTAAAIATVLAAPAFAQSAADTKPMTDSKTMTDSKPMTPSATAPANTAAPMSGGFVSMQNSSDWRTSKLVGASVYGPDNASIGEIDDVILASDGKVNAVVIGVGGFLGVGSKAVAIPFSDISVTRKADSNAIEKITVKYTKDQLKNAPQFAYYEPAKSATTGSSTTAPAASRPMAPATTPSTTR